jgi:hypothetical protein
MALVEYTLLRYSELPVVPVRYEGKNKVPLKGWEWGKWKDGGQSEEDRKRALELFERGNCDGLAIVCGTPIHINGERLYFFAIDIDLPAKEALEAFRKAGIITRLEQTLRGRLHAYFFARSPPPPNIPSVGPLEFKGYGRLVVVYPSRGYKKLNDSPPKIVDDALEVYGKICRTFGHDLEEKLAEESGETETDQSTLSERLRAIVEELRRKGLNPRRGPNYYTSLCPFHEEKHPSFAINHRKFYAIDYHDGKVYKLVDLAKKLGLELVAEVGEDSSPPKIKPMSLVGGEVIGDALVEVVAGPKLLIYHFTDGRLEVAEEFRLGDKAYRPYHTFPYPLADVPKAIGPDPTLWVDTREFIRAYFDHLDPRVYDIMTAAVAWSYFYRDVGVSTPYILFLGPWRSGKTRALEVLESLCYKGVRVVDPSEASLFRSIELLRPTLLIDESQIVDQNVRAVMASGYRYGSKVMRVLDPEADGFDGIKFYDTFSFIVYASREEPPSDIFSRSITIHCEKNTRPTLKRIDEARALELRTRWLAQKLYLFGKVQVTFEEFQSSDGRLQELFSPLIVMARTFGGEEAAKAVESYGRTVELELSAYEASTPEAELVEAISRIVEEREGDAPEIIYADELKAVLSDEWSPQRIGQKMSALGFRRHRGTGGRRGYIIDLALLRRLKLRYGLFQETLPAT